MEAAAAPEEKGIKTEQFVSDIFQNWLQPPLKKKGLRLFSFFSCLPFSGCSRP